MAGARLGMDDNLLAPHYAHQQPEEQPKADYVWQNERFGPTILERPNYTDPKGEQVPPPWSVTSGGDWAVFVDSGTDLDGWQYSSSFDRFDLDRPGGRASMRLSDSVR
eukprot:scaffold618906_cov22-Prasinocladus_malaysianus.AAC.1